MNVAVAKIGKKWRVVNADSGTPLYHVSHHNPIDGGGHVLKSKALRQAGYVQEWYDKQKKEK